MLDLLPDLCDAHGDQLHWLEAPLQDWGGKALFFGQVVTVKCFEDNSRVKELLATPGQGKVLVVDGGGSTRQALMGDLIAKSAVDNGWAGVVIFGAIRDAGEIATLALGVKALGVTPFKTERKGHGETGIALRLGGVNIRPGMWLYADKNGVVLSDNPIH
ncbi:putative 4-hydroxy-4-methyl-2-oxoglutarate aldolase [Gallaecimonas pentaromativorans]|uniref:4-hydroxy-4-methyl-2-oxoglutarate aldolase n=1 Tax=Gallaecimonas pentaromativorans TaxID=584787 RepID=A0A3N1PNQ9_9GAMM|nr:putative 4-hydroxy-4-methyl-2-oxoglutarate aldolase [Gallaecimonas pentaromativorans]ROQ29799.1 regulator of ribonuclease activity A [Gallaecimonas pentaromativorans]